MKRAGVVGAVLGLALALAACAGADDDASRQGSQGRATASTAPTTLTTPAPTTLATEPPTTFAPATFDGTVHPIGDAERARMTSSWRPGCPVPLDELRLVALRHWGYDGTVHQGELVVHADHAESIVHAFRLLFEAHFPIERMQLVDEFQGDDHASTLANNTAAFNCRAVVGAPGSWSEHAFGRAIDVNPRVNPYVLDPRVEHPALAPFLDRTHQEPGMVRPDDAAVAAFAAVGWSWGGTWSAPDYQHFSATGR